MGSNITIIQTSKYSSNVNLRLKKKKSKDRALENKVESSMLQTQQLETD